MLEPLPQDEAWPRNDDVELPTDLLLRDWTARLGICGLVTDSIAGYFYCKRTEALWAVTTICRTCGPQVAWLCSDDVLEVLISLYVPQLQLFCTLAQRHHQIVALMEVREMPSTAKEHEATLAEYDLAPDKTCRWSPHPDHEECGDVARYSLEGRDSVCGQVWVSYTCDWHAPSLWTAARCGNWCACAQHTGHMMVDLALSRLV
ncbi:MAG: hypothetical protein ACR2KG_00005 [Nocardioidaceae bacterium]